MTPQRCGDAHLLLSGAALLFLTLVAGCVTPSTLLVNRQAKVMRCASYGYGNAIAIGTAGQIHDSCVRDARMIGFVPIPEATLGFAFDEPMKKPLRVNEVSGSNAQAAGLRVGDYILEVDSKEVESFWTVITVLNTKKVGDRVSVKVQRDQQILPLTIVTTRRE